MTVLRIAACTLSSSFRLRGDPIHGQSGHNFSTGSRNYLLLASSSSSKDILAG